MAAAQSWLRCSDGVNFCCVLAVRYPVLPPETYVRYAALAHFQPPRIETHQLGRLRQIYADQFGWEEMVAVVARVLQRLPPEVGSRTAIFGQNYGHAGAIDLFGRNTDFRRP
jgi:hypothetical protein